MQLSNEISDRWNPMLYKELLQSLRRTSFAIPFMVTQAVALIALSIEVNSPDSTRYLWIAISIICAGLIPMTGLTLMSEELEDGNHELLQLANLSRWKIAMAKFTGLWSACALNFIATLPYILVRYFWGKVELAQELVFCLLVLGTAAVHCAGAIASSSYRTKISRILIYLLFIGSAIISISIAGGAAGSRGMWLWPTLNLLIGFISFWLFGMSLIRARLRISLMTYEIHPDRLVIILLVLVPFATVICSLMTAGYVGSIAIGALAFLCIIDDLVENEKPAATTNVALGEPGVAITETSQDRLIGE